MSLTRLLVAGALLFAITGVCAASPPVAFKFKWEPLTIVKGQVVAVGPHKLPLPLALPQKLVPLGKLALVHNLDDHNHALVYQFFFDCRQEALVRKWAITHHAGLTSHNLQSAGEWDYAISLRKGSCHANFIWSAMPRLSQVPVSNPELGAGELAMYATGSPVADQNRVVRLSAAYAQSSDSLR